MPTGERLLILLLATKLTPQHCPRQMCVSCSLAIMTDAAHLLSDVGGFAVAIFAAQYASKRSQQSHTFG